MFKTISRFLRDEAGTTAMEYSLIAALVSLAIVSSMQALAGSTTGLFDLVKSILQAAIGGN